VQCFRIKIKLTKALANGESQKNYHLNTNEGFLISFNFQFNYIYFLTISLWEWKSKSIACLLSGSEHMYIGLGALKLMCTQYGFCGLGNLQECKNNFLFWSWAGWATFSNHVHISCYGVAEGLQVMSSNP
jgi:hypothetical protein